MKITIQTLKFKETPELNKFINEKVEKLFLQQPNIIRAEITLKQGAKNNPTNKWCEIYLSIPGENKFVKRNSTSYEESILKSVETMKKILRRLPLTSQ